MAKKIINWWMPQVSRKAHMQLGFWGGEPLLEWKKMQKIILWATEKAEKMGFKEYEFGGTTNGVLYTPDKVQWCLDHKSLMLISLDGIQASHDKNRCFPNGKGSWETVVRNLKAAREITGKTKCRMSFDASTVDHFFESIQFFVEELGVTNTAFAPVYEDNWNKKALAKLREQYMLAADYCVKKAEEGNPIVLKHINDEALIQYEGGLKPQNPCGAGSGYTGWSVDGFMFPCHRFNKHGITTAERAKLPTIIARPEGDSFEYVNNKWRMDNFAHYHKHPSGMCLNECKIYLKGGCKGGCYAVNYDLTGSVYEPPKPLCDIAHILNDVGIYYAQEARKKNLEIKETGWSDAIRTNKNKGGRRGSLDDPSCTCYNLCYLEGTPNEVIHIDRRNDKSCICYQTSYQGPENPQHRPIKALDRERATLRAALRTCARILAAKLNPRHPPATEDQLFKERTFLRSLRKVLNL
jgi:radical SAM protein with 4Fe4S-binding SPASM domain